MSNNQDHMVATAEQSSVVGAAPHFIRSVVEMDCFELRDIAEWFDLQGKKSNGDFLRHMATRHEILFGAYEAAAKSAADLSATPPAAEGEKSHG